MMSDHWLQQREPYNQCNKRTINDKYWDTRDKKRKENLSQESCRREGGGEVMAGRSEESDGVN